jgi:hypothetical protein
MRLKPGRKCGTIPGLCCGQTLGMQYQPTNNLLVDVSYVGNRGVHQVLPIPFNQPGIATPSHPINGQIYSYGYNATKPPELRYAQQ